MNNSLTYHEWLRYMKEQQNTIVSGRFYSKSILERLEFEDGVEYTKDYKNLKKPPKTGFLSGILQKFKQSKSQ
jgi:hypothetical protein